MVNQGLLEPKQREEATKPKTLEPNWGQRAPPPPEAGGNSSIADWLQWELNKIGKYIKENENQISHGRRRDLQIWKSRKLERILRCWVEIEVTV